MGFPDKNTGVGCHFLLQGIFPNQGWNPHLLHCQADSLPLSHQGSPIWKVALQKICYHKNDGQSHIPGAIMGDPTHDKVMRRRPKTYGCSGYKGSSRLTLASTQPCILPFSMLSLLVLLRIFALPAESSPAPLSLNKDQHRTLINKFGRWFPMKGPGIKEMFQVKPLLLALWLVWHMHTNVHDCSQHLNRKEPDHKRP